MQNDVILWWEARTLIKIPLSRASKKSVPDVPIYTASNTCLLC